VEFDFPIINQVQVNVKAGLSFSAALRSILRQDPNIVMVGEIRDRETAQIAIRAALTGHLVLSTLHTNDAASAPTRLVDMGVEPYLVASALQGVLAQRLVQRSCPECTESVELDPASVPPEVFDRIQREGLDIKQGKGCRSCNNTGYRGRVAIHELLRVDDDIERSIVRQLPATQVAQIARRQGMVDLFGDGLLKVQSGLTSLEQVLLATRSVEESDPVEEAASIVESVVETETAPVTGGGF
jgi:type IV pilus assembly protein PilB